MKLFQHSSSYLFFYATRNTKLEYNFNRLIQVCFVEKIKKNRLIHVVLLKNEQYSLIYDATNTNLETFQISQIVTNFQALMQVLELGNLKRNPFLHILSMWVYFPYAYEYIYY